MNAIPSASQRHPPRAAGQSDAGQLRLPPCDRHFRRHGTVAISRVVDPTFNSIGDIEISPDRPASYDAPVGM